MPRLAREVEPILRHKTEGKYKTRIIDYEKIIPSYTQLSSNNLRNSATIIKGDSKMTDDSPKTLTSAQPKHRNEQ